MAQPDLILRAALDAAERGWHLFPLRLDDKRPAGHREDRCPGTGRCHDGHLTPEQRATTDLALIRRCWGQGQYGIGIATGPSGLVVIDLDVPKTHKKDAPDGAATLQALCERTGRPLPDTFTVRTGSGGRHLYFQAPAGARLRNSQHKLGPAIDTRAGGGYVVAPGTTVEGRPYTPLNPTTPLAVLPDWLHALLAPPRRTARVDLPVARDASAFATAALRNETAAVEGAVEGSRNWALTRAARALGRFVARGDLARDVVEEALNGAGQAAGLTAQETAATVTSALNWSIRNNPQQAA
ncbi:bifunctional DNA primase/polymerase [Streptomyces decoyicus]|uniref:bifunctional DNA primase/polymerase n=1 Tax=Streptomyces decoyicus TaxID=249567 RepID=UPI0037F5D291